MKQDFLYSAQFDFPYQDSSPRKIISLLFVPRSGSTLLSCLMAQTEMLGFPLEYFSKINLPLLSARLSQFSKNHIDPLLHIRSSSNGVFSYKWNYGYEQAMPEIGKRLKPDYYVVMDREDKHSQARSLIIAKRTQEWVRPRSQDKTAPPHRY